MRVGQGRRSRRLAVVTGAASGIGLATVRLLASVGLEVIAIDRDANSLSAVEELGVSMMTADLARARARAEVCRAVPAADYLVNAAGIVHVGPILEVSETDWRGVFAVNTEAVFFLCQQLGARLRPGGAIVNVSSSSAKLASTVEVSAYAASKAAVLSITRSFAHALAGIPIRVNAICPGLIDTPMQDAVLSGVASARSVKPSELEAARIAGIPLRRRGSAEECASLIRFLLSDDAAYMTGQAVNLTGGLVTW